ncbi:hypothetical protein HXX76_001658 [Chlamydomonas incerta]|uniref:Endonuclease/exonuclease/phosphatase domain-containing protein n=1 Tax=Chlamydomonas incerta TaxID=51695 RepID=A0A836B1P8_CHLIN|nr:hypothetical protein HXX76_001658 [Chlamydomonas incerta]|eukprot:KAG2444922.1 hypothetical protein HXX76_001658 [Chlamydomonas incerta]
MKGAGAQEPDAIPDYVWCRTTLQGEARLDVTWKEDGELLDSYSAACTQMERYRSGQTSGRCCDAKTFFRYPPITVVLRRIKATTGSDTTYVITTAHTPGSSTVRDLEQLAREVEWLFDRYTYGRIMQSMVELKKMRSLLKGGQLLPNDKVVHVVAGDLNTQLFKKAEKKRGAGLGLPPSRGDGKKSALEGWVGFQGRDDAFSEPSGNTTFPDVVYVLKESVHKLRNPGIMVLPLAKVSDMLFSGGSDHKPLLVSFREVDQEARAVLPAAVAVKSLMQTEKKS